MKSRTPNALLVFVSLVPMAVLVAAPIAAPPVTVTIDTPMRAPAWATLQRRLLADNVPACREFYEKYYDSRGYIQCFLRWGANDGPDDAFENFNRWPELHALGADDEILKRYLAAFEGMTRQYSEAKTTDVVAGRDGMYVKEFSAQSDWMHHGEGLQLFNRMALSVPALPAYRERARRFAGFYMGEDPDAPNYDPDKKLIRSMINGSRGPLLRKATALDWVGDPFDATGFVALHGESTYQQFLEHYQEYTDVAGDHFLNLVATTLPTNAYLATGEAKYRQWIVEYMDAWLARMQTNGGIIPSFVDLDGRIGGAEGRWWGNAYGWGFSPVNPVTGKREDRNRIPRALVGFSNALLVTGDRKYVDAWRAMIDAVNANARVTDGRKEYPSMRGADGWYGWRPEPWRVGALEVWYWSMRDDDRARVGDDPWLAFLDGKNDGYPEAALQRDLESIPRRLAAMRADRTSPEKRLADNMLDYNPAATDALVRLMLGALVPGREGGLLNARLRYFDPVRKRAGVPEDVAALVSALGDRRTVVTLVNVNPTTARTVVVQAGAYAEHQIESVGGERADGAGRRARRHRAARAGGRRDAHAGDGPLRQHADRGLPLGSLTLGGRAPIRLRRRRTPPPCDRRTRGDARSRDPAVRRRRTGSDLDRAGGARSPPPPAPAAACDTSTPAARPRAGNTWCPCPRRAARASASAPPRQSQVSASRRRSRVATTTRRPASPRRDSGARPRLGPPRHRRRRQRQACGHQSDCA